MTRVTSHLLAWAAAVVLHGCSDQRAPTAPADRGPLAAGVAGPTVNAPSNPTAITVSVTRIDLS